MAVVLQPEPQPRHRGLGCFQLATIGAAGTAGGGAHRHGISCAREGEAVVAAIQQQGAEQATGCQPQVQVYGEGGVVLAYGLLGRHLQLALAVTRCTPGLQPIGEAIGDPRGTPP